MIAKGWMRKEDDSGDARHKHLFITPKGLRVLENAKVATFPLLVDSFSCLSDEELADFHNHRQLLKQFLDAKRNL